MTEENTQNTQSYEDRFRLEAESVSKWLTIGIHHFMEENGLDTENPQIAIQSHSRFLVELIFRLVMNGVDSESVRVLTNSSIDNAGKAFAQRVEQMKAQEAAEPTEEKTET